MLVWVDVWLGSGGIFQYRLGLGLIQAEGILTYYLHIYLHRCHKGQGLKDSWKTGLCSVLVLGLVWLRLKRY